MSWLLDAFNNDIIDNEQWEDLMVEWNLSYSFQLSFRYKHNMSKQALFNFLDIPYRTSLLNKEYPYKYVRMKYKDRSFRIFLDVLIKLSKLRNTILEDFKNTYETTDSSFSWFIERNYDIMREMGIDIIWLGDSYDPYNKQLLDCVYVVIDKDVSKNKIKEFVIINCKFLDFSKVKIKIVDIKSAYHGNFQA